MKKVSFFLASMFFLLFFSNAASAQQKNFFTGKWDVLVVGTPQGDAKMVIEFIEKDGVLSGNVFDPVTNKEISKLNKIEAKEKSITGYFTSQGYEVYLFLEKEGPDKVSGSLMDMFDASGTRIKE